MSNKNILQSGILNSSGKMKKIIATTFLLAVYGVLFSQQKTQTIESANAQIRLDTLAQRHHKLSGQTRSRPIAPARRIDINDEYMGRKDEILILLKEKKIPHDFPKYKKGSSEKDYDHEMENYYRHHPEVLNEKYRKKFM